MALKVVEHGWPTAAFLQKAELRVAGEALVNPGVRRREIEVRELLQGGEQKGAVFRRERHQQQVYALERRGVGVGELYDLGFGFGAHSMVAKPFIHQGRGLLDGLRIVVGLRFVVGEVSDADRRLVQRFETSHHKKWDGRRQGIEGAFNWSRGVGRAPRFSPVAKKLCLVWVAGRIEPYLHRRLRFALFPSAYFFE